MSEQVAKDKDVDVGREEKQEVRRKELLEALKKAANILARTSCPFWDCDKCPLQTRSALSNRAKVPGRINHGRCQKAGGYLNARTNRRGSIGN